MNSRWQPVIYYILPFLLLVFAIFSLISINSSVHQHKKEAESGILTLTEQDIALSDTIELNGEWEFYSEQLLVPDDFIKGTVIPSKDNTISVPGSWKGHDVDGEKLSSKGYATYRLTINLPDTEKRLGLAINSITASYQLWMNGKVIDEKGSVGTSRETTKPFKKPEVVQIEPQENQVEIVIQVANFSQRKAGVIAPIQLGEYEQLKLMKDRKAMVDGLLVGCILITGLYHFVLFARMRHRYDSLWFGLICVISALKNSVEGQYILSLFLPNVSNNTFITLEYIGFMAGPLLFSLFIYSFFPKLISNRIRDLLWMPGAFFMLVVLVTPVHIFTELATVMQIYTVIVALVLMQYILKAAMKRLEGSILLALGAAVFFVAIINDILMNNGTVIQTGTYFSFGLLFMIICMEIILSFKLYNAYKKIKQMSYRMIELDKIKNEFLANTSHELRTPLNGMIGLAQSLLYTLKSKLKPNHKLQLQMIVSSGQRLSYLINDILDYSRLSNNDIRLNVTQVNLYQLVQVVFTVVQPLTAGRELTLKSNISREFPLIEADESRLEQILFNLVGNAIKYTPQGEITVGATLYDKHVEIYVEDTGVGIAEERFEFIFKPFEQLDGVYEAEESGSGLGLKITKQLVEMHKGEIWVESEEGKGSRFTFTIHGDILYKNETVEEWHENDNDYTFQIEMKQFADREEIASTVDYSLLTEATRSEKTIRDDGRFYRVLIVDDEAINLQVVTQQLTPLPLQIETVINGEQVINRINELHHYDLIIADLMMPGMSGFELCREIRKSYTLDELPILIMTAGYREDTIIAAFNAGANDYISKPFGHNELLSRVKNLILMRRAVREVRSNAKEVMKLNSQLTELNANLEVRIQERTIKLEEMNDILALRNQELNRLESARRRLLSDVSHELRSPLTSIQGYVEAITSGIVDAPQERHRYLEMVLGKTHTLSRLIQDLVELSRLETRRSEMIFEIVLLPDLIEQIKDKYAFDVEQAGLEYRFQLMFDLKEMTRYQVVIDMERIYQVLTNLVTNAVKFTEAGGKISIICELNLKEKTENTVGELVIYVEDTGYGIKSESLPYVFDRFYRERKTSPNNGDNRGSGIGLAIAKEIVEYHDGTIQVLSSVEGEGTTFSFTLPLYQFE